MIAADAAAVDVVEKALRRGEVVAVPTDTVYGIAVDPLCAGATERLFAAKGRPRGVPVAVLVADVEQAWALAASPLVGRAAELAELHWPGALTIVVSRSPHWTVDLGDDGATVGLRCPDHRWLLALLRRVGPLATTSANRHGAETPQDAAGVAGVFGPAVTVVVDGGPCTGAASTVVDCTGNDLHVLRQGSVVV